MALPGPAPDACRSCGRSGDLLEEVRRVYLRLDGQGRLVATETAAEDEPWCPTCRALYPHRRATTAPPDEPSSDSPAP